MFFYVLLLIFSIYLFDYILTGKRKKLTSNISGPKCLPLIGSFLPFLKTKQIEEVIQLNKKFLNKYGKTYKIWIGERLTITTSDIKYIEIILNSNKFITKHIMYDMLSDWLGTGLLLSTGQKWYTRRKIITPSFHFKILEQFIPIFNQKSTILVEKLKNYDKQHEFDIQKLITLLTLDVMAECAMGTKLNAQTYPDSEYATAVKELSQILSDRFISIFYRSKLIFSLFKPQLKQQQDKAIEIIHNYTKNIIKERRKLLGQNAINRIITQGDDEIGIKKKAAFLDVLLCSTVNGKPLTDSDIQEEVDTFLFEGHDTTTSGICFTLYLLSRHKNVQTNVYDEICRVIGDDKESLVDYKELSEFKYLECVIKESLRLYPPVPFIGRLAEEDCVINGHYIPKNTNFSMCMDEMMRDPDLFDNPDEFQPERHMLEKINSFAFVPFSAGPRNCIGQKFAMLEMKIIIIKILQNYELLPMGPEIQPVNFIVLKSRTGFHLGIKSRT